MNQPGGPADAATLATLEFPVVIERIALGTTCELGRADVEALLPGDAARANEAFDLIEECVGLLEAGSDVGFAGATAVEALLARAQVGASLSGAELAGVGRTERALLDGVRAIRTHFERHARHRRSRLADYADTRRDTDALVRRLDEAIADDGSVLDGASAELGRVRRQQRALAEEIRRRVEDVVRSPATAKLLSEPIVTVRSGRYVVPVRIEFASQFAGVVHDQSASGATVYVEPLACVDANNRLRALESAEAREAARVLAELTAAVASSADDLRSNSRTVAALDSIAARARWARSTRSIAPTLVDTASLRIVRGRHPLLRREPVPLDFEIGIAADAVVISGPNMGGKTVVLKTAGLFCALAYSGIPLPAGPGTEIGRFDRLACVIGDDQSIANDLSSFSAHLRSLRDALAKAGPRTLVLVDEIGGGTEPAAGAALAQSFIEAFMAAGARIVVTTHYSQLKVFAASNQRAINASMVFDPQTREPAYVLAMGVPGQSHAFALARSLGIGRQVIERAEALLDSDERSLETALQNMEADRKRLAEQAARVEDELVLLRAREAELRQRLAEAQDARSQFERKAAAALEQAAQRVREELAARAQRSEMDARRQRPRPAPDAGATIEKTMAEIRASLGLAGPGVQNSGEAPQLAVGDAVFVRSFGQRGVVSEIYERDVLVTIGAVKAVVERSDVTRDAAAPPQPHSASRSEAAGRAALDAATSIDVRGMRVDEALPVVDKALDDAALAGLGTMRIIHGKGTGQLGRGIREFLRAHAQVQATEFAPDREGGTGVTVVTLR